VVLPDRERSESLADDLSDEMGEALVAFFPGGEPEIEDHVSLNPRKMGQQMQVLRGLLSDEIKIVCTTPDGLALKMPSPKYFQDRFILIAVKMTYSLHKLIERLSDFGYVRESMVEKPGELSVRGGILDIFPFTGEMPHRIEFFGDEIESIREFDIQTQISTHPVQSLLIVPTSAAWLERTDSILSYLPDKAVLFMEDPDLILAEIDKRDQQGDNSLFQPAEMEKIYMQKQTLFHHTIHSKSDFLDFGGKGIQRLGRSPQEIRKGIVSLCSKRERVILLCESKKQTERIHDLLDLIDRPVLHLEIMEGTILEGFDLPSSGLTVYSERELFGRIPRRRKKERFSEGAPIRELSEIKLGDFVVHIDYGIGVYQGLEKITVNQVSRECLSIVYRDKDKLYVPVDKIERVQKYAGKEGACPELSKLGTKRWEQVKQKTKQSIKNIAKDLIALYSERKTIPGFSFSADTGETEPHGPAGLRRCRFWQNRSGSPRRF
jgi:transcription-repair coupling factor (superfamily II helicase)